MIKGGKARTAATIATGAVVGGLAAGLATPTYALSIGVPQFDSRLTQLLDMKVPVADIDTLVPAEAYSARLLPADAYSAFGLESPAHPADDFIVSVVPGLASQFLVHITSARPMREPILILLLEIRLGQEKWIRQIDLLLDPPSPARASADTPERIAQAPRVRQGRASSAPTSRSQVKPLVEGATSRVQSPSRNSEEERYYGPVRDGESLSRIAQRARPDRRISIAEMAAALRHYNPAAFYGSMHEIRQGVTLRVPSMAELAQLNSRLSWYRDTDAEPQIRATEPIAASSLPDQRQTPATPKLVHAKQYVNGRFFALDLSFASYIATQPKPTKDVMAALEAAEPISFKADWTLELPASVAARAAASAPATAATLPMDTNVESSVVEASATTAQTSISDPSEPAAEDGVESEFVDSSLSAVEKERPAEAATNLQATEVSESASATNVNSSNQAKDSSTSWWWLLIPAGIVAWLVRRRVSDSAFGPTASPSSRPTASHPAPPPAQDKPNSPAPEKPTVLAHPALRKRIRLLQEQASEAGLRELQVAGALLDRDQIGKATRIIDELEQQKAAQPPASAPADSALAKDTSSNEVAQVEMPPAAPPAAAPKPANNIIEFIPEPARTGADESASVADKKVASDLRKKLSAMSRRSLPNEAVRQLKVAEALLERGHYDSVQRLIDELEDSLKPRTGGARS